MELDQNSSFSKSGNITQWGSAHSQVDASSLWQLTLCWVWLAQNNTSARQPAKSNQRKYFKRNDCARKEEAYAPLLKSGRLLLKSESQRTTLCQGHKGKLGWHACYFPSLLSSIIKKKGDKLKRRELWAILSLDNRDDDCVLSTRRSQTKRQLHVAPLLVVYRPHIQDCTKALLSIQL